MVPRPTAMTRDPLSRWRIGSAQWENRGHGQEPWVYPKLRNFRAGIEADISCFERAYVLARCTWRGLDHFRAYVWSSVVAYNLVLFARLKPA